MLILSIVVGVLSITSSYSLQQRKIFNKKKTASEYGKYLKGHVFKTTNESVNPQHCLADCWAENERCQSFNFLVEQQFCELNNKSKENAPGDYIDRDGSVYCSNPAFGKSKKLQMPRHNMKYSTAGGDPCASNPCNSGDCVKHEKTEFRCVNCRSGYYGLFCEQREDPCLASPCLNGGICRSTAGSFACVCSYPLYGTLCQRISWDYQFDLNGTSDVPTLRPPSNSMNYMSLWFWFKTEQHIAYFFSFIPDDPNSDVLLSVWKNGSTFFVQMWKDKVYNFSFPYAYPVNDNTWHCIFVTFRSNTRIRLYLDGASRENEKIPGGALHLSHGTVHLGYYKDSDGLPHYFNGSISHLDYYEREYDPLDARILSWKCPADEGYWSSIPWIGSHLARKMDPCTDRIPLNGITWKSFEEHGVPQWLEQSVSSPGVLTSFTLSFRMHGEHFPGTKPYQIACYGSNGECGVSLTIQSNMTLAILIASTRLEVDLTPIFDSRQHSVIMTWTNQGVLEVIIDAVLQSRLINIETNGEILEKSRFLVGGSDVYLKNYVGQITELNMWNTVLPADLLYLMAKLPGNDRGNVVSWKNFSKPSDDFGIEDWNEIGYSVVEYFERELKFESRSRGNFAHYTYALYYHAAFTITMWIKLASLPAVLFSYTSLRSPKEIYLSIDVQGNITWTLKNSEIRVGEHSPNSTNTWHFIAVSWNNQGILRANIDGIHSQVSSSFMIGHTIHYKGTWYIGSLNASFVGRMGQVTIWRSLIPIAAIRAMSRGGNSVRYCCYVPSIGSFKLAGNVSETETLSPYFSPTYTVQQARDDYCNDVMPHRCSRYYARFGFDGNNGLRLGCFCETELSADMNFNFGNGNYSHWENLCNILS